MEEKSFEMHCDDEDDWELLPSTHHLHRRTLLDLGLEGEGDKSFVLCDRIDGDYFSVCGDRDGDEQQLNLNFKDIEVAVPLLGFPSPLAAFEKLNEDGDDEFVDGVDAEVESLKVSTVEPLVNMIGSKEDEKAADEEERFYQEDGSEKESEFQEEGGGGRRKRAESCWDRIGVLGGVGALCSLGVAAATICIFVLGGSHHQQQHSHKIQCQHYTEDKRMKQVMQQATRLNQAFTAARGASITRAHISFGGYYDGL